jgi:hypothetical protein
LKLKIFDRKKQGCVPYLEFPELVRRYEYYVDAKRSSNGESEGFAFYPVYRLLR